MNPVFHLDFPLNVSQMPDPFSVDEVASIIQQRVPCELVVHLSPGEISVRKLSSTNVALEGKEGSLVLTLARALTEKGIEVFSPLQILS